MRFKVEIEANDIRAVRQILEVYGSHPIVQYRWQRNIAQTVLHITREDMWWVQIMCLITTRNKSGAGSSVEVFLQKKPFPLSLEECINSEDIDNLIKMTLSRLHIRRWKISTDFAIQNFHNLQHGGWETLENLRDRLLSQHIGEPNPGHYQLERTAADETHKLLKGLGPKQSRNFWQDLGLTRYEIPLDSRVLGWCHLVLNFDVPSYGLSDEKFYCQVMDALRELCIRADVLPCLLDAAIFASAEKPDKRIPD